MKMKELRVKEELDHLLERSRQRKLQETHKVRTERDCEGSVERL